MLYIPYLTFIANRSACPDFESGEICAEPLTVLGLSVLPGAVAGYAVSVTTLLCAALLPMVGAIADRTPRRKELLGAFAWTGAAAAAAMFFVADGRWQLGLTLLLVSVVCFAAAQVVYTSILVTIATPDERDRVSSVGWAFGYLGGGLLLSFNLAMVSYPDAFGVSAVGAVRVSLLSAGLWWAMFTVIPVLRLRNLPLSTGHSPAEGSVLAGSFRQLWLTLQHVRRLPVTLLFLVAFLFYNDGIQTVIAMASLYGSEALGFGNNQLIQLFLLVQLVAFAGALVFGRVATMIGAKRTILGGILAWIGVVVVAYLVPSGDFALFVGVGAAIGLVMGGTQALSRSAYSQLIPPGKEAEFFALYQAGERGTSWFGTFVFASAFTVFGSYRPALLTLVAFFVIGGVLLLRVDMRRGIADAGNEQPAKV